MNNFNPKTNGNNGNDIRKSTNRTDLPTDTERKLSRKIVLFLNVPFPTMLEIFLYSFPTNKKLPRKRLKTGVVPSQNILKTAT
ncbi:hypothetical protein NQ315_003996 [Exocentrus adspersus]|uniref:Uncharacterized protein n=1 Tax=Exocentrus adspersus TaxID=1586481 RepID=A0AAV8V5E5_9CUCU|nr:hypothetical protein NQ315_003996 [Exocentrus adspersus]